MLLLLLVVFFLAIPSAALHYGDGIVNKFYDALVLRLSE